MGWNDHIDEGDEFSDFLGEILPHLEGAAAGITRLERISKKY